MQCIQDKKDEYRDTVLIALGLTELWIVSMHV